MKSSLCPFTITHTLTGVRKSPWQGNAATAEVHVSPAVHGCVIGQLCDQLATRLANELDRCYTGRYLRLCRQFYSLYPRIRKSPISDSRLPAIWKSLISESDRPADDALPSVPSLSMDRLIASLSFTHFIELMRCEEPLKRAFYEIECVRGGWSVRELKRQIATLYFERSALSRGKAKLAELVQATAEKAKPRLAIRDPYVFEFLGLKPHEVLRESDVEEALLDWLKAFLLELGHGFCFEARQKRILIGGTHGIVDLVFYHRILKCHVLIELKSASTTTASTRACARSGLTYPTRRKQYHDPVTTPPGLLRGRMELGVAGTRTPRTHLRQRPDA